MNGSNTLVPFIDRTDFNNAVRDLLRLEPSLYTELDEVFFSRETSCETGRIFEYLFIADEEPAAEGEYQAVAFRPRTLDERLQVRAKLGTHDGPIPADRN